MNNEHSHDFTTQFDQTGFIKHFDMWSDEIAIQTALSDGIGELTKSHWQIIYFLREHYLESRSLPPPQHICHVLGKEKHCLDHLFSSEKEAWRIAGLPDPGEEAKTLMT